MNEQTFSRNEDHLYLIVGSPISYYTGLTYDGFQVLIVPLFPIRLVVFFDIDGKLMEVEEHALMKSLETSDNPVKTLENATETTHTLNALFQRIGYKEGRIRVKRFFLNKYKIGIRDFPEIFIDTIRNPSRYCSDEIAVAKNELNRWSKEGVFELNFSTDLKYWINQLGIIEAT